ncbi:MAG: LysM peptidoglycan-binding domain-containing protein [Candidatus Competibacteraceae bacterium]|nr:MAG: LysM peptidoglycan-binding domain-containing protein [Candidatus Competibacteraceae bacterium]
MKTFSKTSIARSMLRWIGVVGMLLGFWLGPTATAHSQEWLYTVRPGDNLWNITADHLTRMDYLPRLQALNQVADPYRLPPGMKLRIPVAWLKARPTAARVVGVQGDVETTIALTGRTVAVTADLLLHGGDEIRTGADGNVTVEFGDGSRMLVQADSRLVMDALSAYGDAHMVDTRLRLWQGRVDNRVTSRRGSRNRYEILTPAATSAVRGTRYRLDMDADDATARAEVLEGAVEIRGTRKTRTVTGGFGALTETGKAPESPVRLLVPPVVGDLPPVVTRSPIQLSFPAVEGATLYRAQIAPDERFETLLFDAVATAPVVRGPDPPDGDYVLRVRGIDARGLEGRDATHRFRLHARPEPPFLIQPVDRSAVLDQALSFEWAEPQNATAYHFQLAEDERFTALALDLPKHARSRLIPDRTLEPGRYFWRVATQDAAGRVGPFSDPQTFRLQATPKLQVSEVTANEMTFRWSAGLPSQQYQFQLARDPRFENVMVDRRVPEPQLTIPRPASGFYYLRMRTIDADGYAGPYGPTQRIEVPPAHYWPLLFLTILGLILVL